MWFVVNVWITFLKGTVVPIDVVVREVVCVVPSFGDFVVDVWITFLIGIAVPIDVVVRDVV